jgi:hypothetical protein
MVRASGKTRALATSIRNLGCDDHSDNRPLPAHERTNIRYAGIRQSRPTGGGAAKYPAANSSEFSKISPFALMLSKQAGLPDSSE